MDEQDEVEGDIDALDRIKHEGVVSRIADNGIVVSLKGNINCEGCKAKAACGVSESNDKEIEIFDVDHNYQLNETVNVVLEKQVAFKAVFWAYLFPFILVILTLIIASFFISELIAGLLSIAVLVPYYSMLHFLNDSFKKTFKVSILKFN